MIMETAVLLNEALESTVYGVNMKLRAVPRFGGHTEPPNVEAVLNVWEDDEVAEGVLTPSDWPALVLDQFASAEDSGEVRGNPTAGASSGAFIELPSVPIQVIYLTQVADIGTAKRDAMYTLRAVRRTISEWMLDSNASTRCRTDLEMEIRSVEVVFSELLNAELREGGFVTGSLVGNFVVRELNPIGA